MTYYPDALMRNMRRSYMNYRLAGLGADEAPASGGQATPTGDVATVMAAADIAAMKAENEALKKENEALKKSMGKFLLGAAVGVAGGYWWRGRRSF